MTTTVEERALFILKVLDAAQSNMFPSEAEIETLSPYVDQIRDDYEEKRGRGFHSAYQQSRAKFITQALHQAQNDKLEEEAACAAGAVLRAIDDGSPRTQVAIAAATAVRSLKSP